MRFKYFQNVIVTILSRSWVYYALAATILFTSVQTTHVQLRKLDELKSAMPYPCEFNQGHVPFDKLGFRRAIRYYKRLMEIAPQVSRWRRLDIDATISRSREMIGFCYYHLGEYEKSLQFYQAALRRKPEFRWLHYNLGIVHYTLGDDQAAQAEFAQAVPDSANLADYFPPLGYGWRNRPSLRDSFKKVTVAAISEVSQRTRRLMALSRKRQGQKQPLTEEELSLLKPIFHPQTNFIPIGFEEIVSPP